MTGYGVRDYRTVAVLVTRLRFPPAETFAQLRLPVPPSISIRMNGQPRPNLCNGIRTREWRAGGQERLRNGREGKWELLRSGLR